MDSSEKQMIIQCDSYKKVQRAYANFKKSPKEKLTTGYLTSRLESLEVYLKDFKNLHHKIIQEIAREKRNSFYYFKHEIYENFEELYYTYRGELSDALQPGKEIKLVQSGKKECQAQDDVRLLLNSILTFSGDYGDWQLFHDLFTALIHNNGALEDVQKFHYLESSLRGELKESWIKSGITANCYDLAWPFLVSEYNNKRSIANGVFKKVFDQKPLPNESATLLKELLDTSVECMKSLKDLDLYTMQSEPLLIYAMVSKLDTVSQKQWEEYISKDNSNYFATFEQLKTFLENKFQTLRDCETTLQEK